MATQSSGHAHDVVGELESIDQQQQSQEVYPAQPLQVHHVQQDMQAAAAQPEQPSSSASQISQTLAAGTEDIAEPESAAHSDASDNNLQCAVCSPLRSFSTVSNRRKHEREVHSATAKIVCPICNVWKYSRDKLKLHLQKCVGPALPSTASTTNIDSEFVVRADEVVAAVVSNEQLDRLGGSFMAYLQASPVSYLEHKFLQRRVAAGSRAAKVLRGHLKFILSIILQQSLHGDSEWLSLRFVCNLEAMQSLLTTLQERRVGAERIHQVVLVCIKLSLFFASEARKTRGAFEVTQLASWAFLRGVCDDAVKQKKRREVERQMLLSEESSDILTPLEAATLSRETIERLHQFINQYSSTEDGEENQVVAIPSIDDCRSYQAYLLVAMMVLAAYRSQTYAHLQLGKTLMRLADGVYQVRYTGLEHSKGHQPLISNLPKSLTPLLDYYWHTVRVRLVAGMLRPEDEDPMYLIPSRTSVSVPRTDFSRLTQRVTLQLIGKPINPHRFRTSMVTNVARSGADDVSLRNLAMNMQHTPETQQRYYARLSLERASNATNAVVQQLYASQAGSTQLLEEDDLLQDSAFQAAASSQQAASPVRRQTVEDDDDDLPVRVMVARLHQRLAERQHLSTQPHGTQAVASRAAGPVPAQTSVSNEARGQQFIASSHHPSRFTTCESSAPITCKCSALGVIDSVISVVPSTVQQTVARHNHDGQCSCGSCSSWLDQHSSVHLASPTASRPSTTTYIVHCVATRTEAIQKPERSALECITIRTARTCQCGAWQRLGRRGAGSCLCRAGERAQQQPVEGQVPSLDAVQGCSCTSSPGADGRR